MRTLQTTALAVLLMLSPAMADPIMVGPIALTGSGVLTSPDFASYGGEGFSGMGMTLEASGSNGTDWVSINTWDIELFGSDAPFTLQNIALSAPGGVGSCVIPLLGEPMVDICNVVIDGISGLSDFTNIGGGIGLLQVYDPTTRVLLAQAEITNTLVEVTDVTYGPGDGLCPTCPSGTAPEPGMGDFVADFLVVDPPSVPEPSSLWLIPWILLAFWWAKRSRVIA